MTSLTLADEASRRTDWPATLDALRAAWNAEPHPDIAKLAWMVLEKGVRPEALSGKRESETQAAWLKVAKSKDPKQLPRLLVTPWPRLVSHAIERVNAFAEWPGDALFAGFALTFIDGKTYGGLKNDRLKRLLLMHLARWRDPVFIEARQRFRKVSGERSGRHEHVKLEAPKALNPATTELLKSIRGRCEQPSPNLEALYAAVYAAPDDDAPRAVLADALIEAGDLRGEFILLQLGKQTQVATRRINELARTYGTTWLGELAPYVRPPIVGAWSALFRRGFPAAVGVEPRASFAGTAAWATVEELVYFDDRAEFTSHPNLRGLRRLLGVVKTLGPPIALKEVVVRISRPVTKLAFTSVHTLGISPLFTENWLKKLNDAIDALAQQPWFKTVHTLALPGGARDLELVEKTLQRFPSVKAVSCNYGLMGGVGQQPSGWRVTLTRERELSLEWLGRNFSGESPENVVEALTAERLARLTSLGISDPIKLTPGQRQHISKGVTHSARGLSLALHLFS